MAGKARAWGAAVLVLLAAALLWVLGVMWLQSTHRSAGRAARPAAAAADATEATSLLDRAQGPDLIRTEIATSDTTECGSAPAAALGTVTCRVVDALTLRPLDEVVFRCQTETRYGEASSPGVLEVKLTACEYLGGPYLGSLNAPGYDGLPVGPFLVTGGSVTDLGQIEMPRGEAVLEGRVVAAGLVGDERIRAELYGEGRNRCEECAEPEDEELSDNGNEAGGSSITLTLEFSSDGVVHATTGRCPVCGYGWDCSRLDADAETRQFRFPHLASGTSCALP
ncbi:MAG: hypothetical protein AB1486_07670 [Planctomycetota bacterium]